MREREMAATMIQRYSRMMMNSILTRLIVIVGIHISSSLIGQAAAACSNEYQILHPLCPKNLHIQSRSSGIF
jgi:hypothetical protein